MRNLNLSPMARPFLGLGLAVLVSAVLSGDLNATEPWARRWDPRRPVPPWGPFFVPPNPPGPPLFQVPIPVPIPEPIPAPFSSILPESGTNVPTDRCLVTPSPIDPRSITVAESIDPGIFVAPRVQGLPVRSLGRSRR